MDVTRFLVEVQKNAEVLPSTNGVRLLDSVLFQKGLEGDQNLRSNNIYIYIYIDNTNSTIQDKLTYHESPVHQEESTHLVQSVHSVSPFLASIQASVFYN